MKKLILLIVLNTVFALHLYHFKSFMVDISFLKNEFIGFLDDYIKKFIFQTDIDPKYDRYKNLYDIDSIHLKIFVDLEDKMIEGDETITLTLRDGLKNEYLIFDCGKNLEIRNVSQDDLGSCFYFKKENFLFVRLRAFRSTTKLKIEYRFQVGNLFYKGLTIDEEKDHLYTLSEPNFSKYWYICKEDPSDKFYADVKITLPENLIAVSNGLLIDTLELEDGKKEFHYRSKYPLSHYLLFIACGEYRVITDFYDLNKEERKLKFEHFVFAESYERAKDDLQLLEVIYDRLKSLIGDYPFIDEIYGIVEVSWPFGGMEHQTRSAITTNVFKGLYAGYSLQAHEFAHQWFGNFVTCNSWKDIWLNESFATFFENLVQTASKKNIIPELQENIFYGSVYRTDGFIFSRVVYDKGACILEMLKYEIGEILFFKCINEYLKRYAYNSAKTEDFIKICNEISGRNLNWFFDQWIYSRINKPVIQIDYNTEKKDNDYFCKVMIKQIQPNQIFKLPLDLILYFQDASQRYMKIINEGETIVYFNSNSKLTGLAVDPENKILKKIKMKRDK